MPVKPPFIEPVCAYRTVGSYASLFVRLSVNLQFDRIIIHISQSIIGRIPTLFHNIKP